MPKSILLRLFLTSALIVAPRPVRGAGQDSRPPDFTGWHLPLPAGKWRISRGPCGSAARFNHLCGYYEDRCAVDLIPLSGSMENVPVLAPQAGQAFFLGQRVDTGLAVMLRHADGRVSAMMHLSKIVVGPDELVAQGQVVGYAGSTGSSGNPHLHFFVQPNAVERECVEVQGLDALDFKEMTATSRNLAWPQLTLPDPPPALPDWLPSLEALPHPENVSLPQHIQLAPGANITLPVAVTGALAPGVSLSSAGETLHPARRASNTAWFGLPIVAPQKAGNYERTWQLQYPGGRGRGKTITVKYSVRPAAAGADLGLILVNPSFVSPSSYSPVAQPLSLCWRVPSSAGEQPFHFRVVVVGSQPADSGWIAGACWQTPALKAGTYYWKVFVRDAQGYMNRTNQRPYAFLIP
ncbi:MAG TPA: M23 family metallopeptidase [Anaerolineales bacterium]|nr:M23 family metallopeptidase [Anaerolineales bacterium]